MKENITPKEYLSNLSDEELIEIADNYEDGAVRIFCKLSTVTKECFGKDDMASRMALAVPLIQVLTERFRGYIYNK
jgi:hypothetical protein